MSKGAFAPATVELGWERAQGCCERCGKGLDWHDRGWGWSAHHREARGSGGSRLPHVSKVSNMLILCGSGVTGCHGIVETGRSAATDLGYLVSRHGLRRPKDVPVLHVLYGWVLLLEDGNVEERTEQ